EEEAGGGADDVALRLAGEEGDARAAELDHRAELACPAAAVQAVLQRPLEPQDAVHDLRTEGGRGLDHDAAGALEEIEEVRLELGGKLVLAGLAAHHHGEGSAAMVENGVENRPSRLELIGTKRHADDVAAEQLDVGEESAEALLARGE